MRSYFECLREIISDLSRDELEALAVANYIVVEYVADSHLAIDYQMPEGCTDEYADLMESSSKRVFDAMYEAYGKPRLEAN